MVQRKAPHKISSQPETKRRHVNKLERQPSSHQQQDARSKGGGDLKKKMKLERSIRAADLESLQDSSMKPKKRSLFRSSPNYMKPTSSSDARKEQLQVTLHPQNTIDKKRSPRNSKNSNSSSSSPGLKLPKALSRQSSLKAIRSLMKKNLLNGVVVNRATCSSTLKDSKFPEALDLNLGGNEAEGTSVMRVCPYTYCSLNGHRHEPLPPLKCFMSARRKLLKTQKSMKLKGLKVKVLGKEKEEIYTGQMATSMEELSDDFFVETYTGNQEEQIINEKGQAEDEDDQRKEPYADTVVEDGLDQSSEISNEVDAMMSFLEYVECDQQVGDAEEEETTSLSLIPEDNGESSVECNDNENKVSAFDFNWKEEVSSPFPDNRTERSECPDDCSGPMPPQIEHSIEQIAPLDACEVAEADEEQQQEVNQEAAEDGDEISPCDELSNEPITVSRCAVAEADAELKQEVYQNVDGNDSESHEREEFCSPDALDQNSKPQEPELSENNDDACYLWYSKEGTSDTSFQGSEEGASEEPEEGTEAVHDLLKLTNDESAILKPEGPEEQQNLLREDIKEEENENEVDDTNSLFVLQLFDSCDNLKESDKGITEYDHIRNQPELFFRCDGETETASISSDIQSCLSDDQSDDSDTGESWKSEKEQQEEVSAAEGSILLKARRRITRKKITEEPDDNREFNPRAPHFLDVEPDPEAEKVDLRHQTMDERKNSEDYLIDCALQRAVTKLAPARKRKVALLVEAFETVMPLPVYEKPVQHATSGFNHARIMQACS